jgi:hypothetical protein
MKHVKGSLCDSSGVLVRQGTTTFLPDRRKCTDDVRANSDLAVPYSFRHPVGIRLVGCYCSYDLNQITNPHESDRLHAFGASKSRSLGAPSSDAARETFRYCSSLSSLPPGLLSTTFGGDESCDGEFPVLASPFHDFSVSHFDHVSPSVLQSILSMRCLLFATRSMAELHRQLLPCANW